MVEPTFGEAKRGNMMNGAKRCLLLAVAALASVVGVQAQVIYYISLDSVVGFPDTVQVGGQLQFSYQISNQGPLAFQGTVLLAMSNAQLADTVTLATASSGTVFTTNSTLAGDVDVPVVVGNALGIGGNVVVVWPRLDNGPSTPPVVVTGSITRNLFVLPPNGIDEQNNPRFLIRTVAGIATIVMSNDQKLASISLTDLMGRTCQHSNNGSAQIDLQQAVPGIYVLTVRTTDGAVYSKKVFVP